MGAQIVKFAGCLIWTQLWLAEADHKNQHPWPYLPCKTMDGIISFRPCMRCTLTEKMMIWPWFVDCEVHKIRMLNFLSAILILVQSLIRYFIPNRFIIPLPLKDQDKHTITK